MILNLDFYLRDDVITIAKELIGKWLMTNINGKVTGGMITETEAYRGPEDRASHAYRNRRTSRNEVMFHQGGISYVYLCYGIHHLFNVVTNKMNQPHAVLIRAIDPTDGLDEIKQRRNLSHSNAPLISGPGTVTQALGINLDHNGLCLTNSFIWIEDRKNKSLEIMATPRIGIDYAKEDAALPWRYVLKPS